MGIVTNSLQNGKRCGMNNDLISRNDLIKAVENLYEYAELGEVIEVIKNAPAIEYTFEAAFQKTVCEQKLYCPTRPKGEWIEHEDERFGWHWITCSNCKRDPQLEDKRRTNFCPNCGAEMRGDQE
jgi:hypothetical protein